MATFDSVVADAPIIGIVSAATFRCVQVWLPLALHAVAAVLYLFVLGESRRHLHTARVLLLLSLLLVLFASLLRRVSVYFVRETGAFRYTRVGSTVTRLLPNTRQSWIVVLTLVALTGGLPLFLYLFTHYTHRPQWVVYGFAMFGLSGFLSSPFLALCIGLLICGGLMLVLYAAVMLPLGGRNPLYTEDMPDRLRAWIRLVSWFPMTLLLLVLFVFSRLLLCGGPLGRYAMKNGRDVTAVCGETTHWMAGLFGWFMVAVAYMCLDVGIAYTQLLGGGPVAYYALEPRLDGLFSELLVWAIKATVAAATVMDPIAADLVAAALFLGLFAFASLRRTATVEALEELFRWSMLVVAFACVVSSCLTSTRIPAVVPALVLPLCWVGSVAAAAFLYQRRFGWEVFASGRDVTADLIII